MQLPSELSNSERILIHAPFGRDGSLIEGELRAVGFSALECRSIPELCEAMKKGAGAALVADEALTPAGVQALATELASQPPWSDFPLIIMTSGGAATSESRYRVQLIEPLRNVSLLERPLRPVTLVSSLRAALRARRHQYQLCQHLNRLETSEGALRESEARFRFLSELGEASRSVNGPEEVTAMVAERLAHHIGVTGCAYALVNPEAAEVTVVHDYTTAGQGATGKYPLSLFGEDVLNSLLQGQTLVISDRSEALRGGQSVAAFASLGMQAVICCPLVRQGRVIAMMAVHQSLPRDWTKDEIELVEEVVERCWAYIERERSVAELAANNNILQETNQELMRANRELEEFGYVASHDLQEPLRMVKIYSQLMVKHMGTDDQTMREYFELVQQGARRMDDLIRDLLTFSSTVHSESPADGSANLDDSLSRALAVLNDRISETGATVQAEHLPEVRGDTSQLTHVFQNLLANSLKYRNPDRAPEIRISATKEQGQWVVAFRDNGIGFEQRFAERIFGLFKRLHKDEYPGTGLGLAICQRIVERYGGRIWATSEPGVGSTFYLSLAEA
jgi:signal transduction histidine kinase